MRPRELAVFTADPHVINPISWLGHDCNATNSRRIFTALDRHILLYYIKLRPPIHLNSILLTREKIMERPHLLYNSKYCVLVCRACQYAVSPNGVKRHLERWHAHLSLDSIQVSTPSGSGSNHVITKSV